MIEYEAVASDVIKAAPPVGISSAVIAGVSIADWALVLTIVYTSIMIAYQAVKFIRLWKNKNGSE